MPTIPSYRPETQVNGGDANQVIDSSSVGFGASALEHFGSGASSLGKQLAVQEDQNRTFEINENKGFIDSISEEVMASTLDSHPDDGKPLDLLKNYGSNLSSDDRIKERASQIKDHRVRRQFMADMYDAQSRNKSRLLTYGLKIQEASNQRRYEDATNGFNEDARRGSSDPANAHMVLGKAREFINKSWMNDVAKQKHLDRVEQDIMENDIQGMHEKAVQDSETDPNAASWGEVFSRLQDRSASFDSDKYKSIYDRLQKSYQASFGRKYTKDQQEKKVAKDSKDKFSNGEKLTILKNINSIAKLAPSARKSNMLNLQKNYVNKKYTDGILTKKDYKELSTSIDRSTIESSKSGFASFFDDLHLNNMDSKTLNDKIGMDAYGFNSQDHVNALKVVAAIKDKGIKVVNHPNFKPGQDILEAALGPNVVGPLAEPAKKEAYAIMRTQYFEAAAKLAERGFKEIDFLSLAYAVVSDFGKEDFVGGYYGVMSYRLENQKDIQKAYDSIVKNKKQFNFSDAKTDKDIDDLVRKIKDIRMDEDRERVNKDGNKVRPTKQDEESAAAEAARNR